MYGTIARWRVQEGKEEELERLADELTSQQVPGSRSVLFYRADNDPREYWVASSWDSREVYHGNARTPEQNARYERLRALLETDPEWHDGEIVAAR